MAGFGLIELLIAMVLGLIVIGAAFAIFMASQNTYRSNEDLSRIQESARVAFELMSRDIRAAGGSACSNFSVVEGSGTEVDRFRDAAVTGGANSLRVVSGDDAAYSVLTSTSTSVTLDPDELDAADDVFDVDDFLLLCNARKTHVVQTTGVSGLTVSFTPLPGGYNPTADEYAPPGAVVLARLRDANWFVDENGRGGNSLFVSRMGGDPQEVAEGVRDLGFEYLQAGSNAYVAATAVADWRNVIAVRMTMTLQGVSADGEALTRTASNVVSMRGRTL
jgi:type IV pilus assembly protein PilW